MRVVFSSLSLWPGFVGVVRRGLWDQLALALLFGVFAQATLFVNFFWRDYLGGYLRASTGVVFLIAWIFLGAVANGRLKRYEKSLLYDADGELFLEAQTRYLRGEWFEAECALKSVLKKNPQDAEALLLLATLCRHTRRFSEARQTLAALEKLEAADYWRYEIGLEKEAIRTDLRALREERLAERKQAEEETQNVESEVPETPELPSEARTVEPPTLKTPDENVPPSAPSLDTEVVPNVGTGRPILRFSLTPNDVKSDAA
ncbi:MAG: tetratricopeptide repeat protein [Thermoguttaceae bacterium]|nr:tetratricopeptide repeat protein [Thermoguttaceae bacterium]